MLTIKRMKGTQNVGEESPLSGLYSVYLLSDVFVIILIVTAVVNI
jgi:hypothetical protein